MAKRRAKRRPEHPNTVIEGVLRAVESMGKRGSSRGSTEEAPRNPFAYGLVRGGAPIDLGDGVTCETRRVRNGWATDIVYRTPTYTARVREISWLMAKREVRKHDLREWIPPGPGEYWVGDGSAIYRFEDPKPHGKVRKFFCRCRLHRKRRVPGFWNRVRQCPYCLKLKIGWPREPGGISIGVGSEWIEQEQIMLRANFEDTRTPNGPGKPAWVAVAVRKAAPGHYVGSLDEAVDKLV